MDKGKRSKDTTPLLCVFFVFLLINIIGFGCFKYVNVGMSVKYQVTIPLSLLFDSMPKVGFLLVKDSEALL